MAGNSYRPTYRKAEPQNGRIVAIVAVLALIAAAIAIGMFACDALQGSEPSAEGEDPTATPAPDNRVSFIAVGDNLPDGGIGEYADGLAGEYGDGAYDYSPIYANIKPYIQAADLSYVNFETHAGGDEIGPRGYPSFNTTDSMVDAVYDTGFDLIASATNHSYDWGQEALNHSASLWQQKPVLFTGTAASEEEAATIKTCEKNGIVFSLLNYTYGVNGYEEDDIPSYAVNYMHEDRIAADVAQAKAISDVVLVSMHWGTENQTYPDEAQTHYAQLLADLEVDVVLGSHPHVIGPLAWVQGATGKQTLVAYSLGNFLSNHEAPGIENELEGMLSCDFVKKEGDVSIENVTWIPLVNHTEEGVHSIYALKDYPPDLAKKHLFLGGYEDPIASLRQLDTEIMGSEFAVDDGSSQPPHTQAESQDADSGPEAAGSETPTEIQPPGETQDVLT